MSTDSLRSWYEHDYHTNGPLNPRASQAAHRHPFTISILLRRERRPDFPLRWGRSGRQAYAEILQSRRTQGFSRPDYAALALVLTGGPAPGEDEHIPRGQGVRIVPLVWILFVQRWTVTKWQTARKSRLESAAFRPTRHFFFVFTDYRGTVDLKRLIAKSGRPP